MPILPMGWEMASGSTLPKREVTMSPELISLTQPLTGEGTYGYTTTEMCPKYLARLMFGPQATITPRSRK